MTATLNLRWISIFCFLLPLDLSGAWTTALIEYIINVVSDKNSIILDSFAGSGTTAHAVLNMNKSDDGNRKFILVEMEDYAEELRAAGYDEATIAKELCYLERVAWENERIRTEPSWNYGFFGPDEITD